MVVNLLHDVIILGLRHSLAEAVESTPKVPRGGGRPRYRLVFLRL